ncbi:hypothetical protein BJX64DRAFT_264765 [Aspergillus heterothallicus]
MSRRYWTISAWPLLAAVSTGVEPSNTSLEDGLAPAPSRVSTISMLPTLAAMSIGGLRSRLGNERGGGGRAGGAGDTAAAPLTPQPASTRTRASAAFPRSIASTSQTIILSGAKFKDFLLLDASISIPITTAFPSRAASPISVSSLVYPSSDMENCTSAPRSSKKRTTFSRPRFTARHSGVPLHSSS